MTITQILTVLGAAAGVAVLLVMAAAPLLVSRAGRGPARRHPHAR